MSKKGFSVLQKSVCLFLTLALVAIPTLASIQTNQQPTDYIQGAMDGDLAAKGDPLWLVGGLLCGLLAVLYCYMQSPTPPAITLVGKSQDYVLGYTEGYKKKKGRNALYAWIGWGSWVVVYLVVILPSVDTN